MGLNISTLKHFYLLEKEGKKLIYTLLEHAQLRTANTHVKTKETNRKIPNLYVLTIYIKYGKQLTYLYCDVTFSYFSHVEAHCGYHIFTELT